MSELENYPDYLTCGVCLQHFPLDHILLFIQHKSNHIEKPNQINAIGKPNQTYAIGKQNKTNAIGKQNQHQVLTQSTVGTDQTQSSIVTRKNIRNPIQPRRNRKQNEKHLERNVSGESTPKPQLCCSLCSLSPKSPDSLLNHLRFTHKVNLY